MSKVVLITGISGQDGSFMADYLIKNTDYRIFGAVRHTSKPDYSNFSHLFSEKRFSVVEMDVADYVSVERVVRVVKPDYFINFAANSYVGNSWDMPVNHFQTNTLGVLNCLEVLRLNKFDCRFYNAGSSEQWGNVDYSPQDINHPFKPRSPYGASKCSAHHIVKVYRESYGMYAVQGLLLNHESERRGEPFVTRKISKNVARIKKEIESGQIPKPFYLGNIYAKRDWSHAEDFMDGIWKMLNQETSPRMREMCLPHYIDESGSNFNFSKAFYLIKDYVLSSNETHTVKEFIEKAFDCLDINYIWRGEGLDEELLLSKDGFVATKRYVPLVKIDPKFYRPAEVDLLLGDSSEARKELAWEPKVSFHELVERMVKHDYQN